AQKGNSLSKFGEWDEKHPAPAEGITVIFNRARVNSKKEGGTPTNMKLPRRKQKGWHWHCCF
ncbi:hypothetical protein SDJN02_06376, partial [Cucurbita argyrosperma subsp. argyrosperma]